MPTCMSASMKTALLLRSWRSLRTSTSTSGSSSVPSCGRSTSSLSLPLQAAAAASSTTGSAQHQQQLQQLQLQTRPQPRLQQQHRRHQHLRIEVPAFDWAPASHLRCFHSSSSSSGSSNGSNGSDRSGSSFGDGSRRHHPRGELEALPPALRAAHSQLLQQAERGEARAAEQFSDRILRRGGAALQPEQAAESRIAAYSALVLAAVATANPESAAAWLETLSSEGCRSLRPDILGKVLTLIAREGTAQSVQQWFDHLVDSGPLAEQLRHRLALHFRTSRLVQQPLSSAAKESAHDVEVWLSRLLGSKAGLRLEAAAKDVEAVQESLEAIARSQDPLRVLCWVHRFESLEASHSLSLPLSLLARAAELRALSRLGEVARAEELLNTYLSDEDEIEEARLNPAVLHKLLLRACAVAGDHEAAGRALREMEELDLYPDNAAYSHVLQSCVEAGSLADVERWFNVMVKKGVPPTSIELSSVLSLSARAGDVERVQVWLRRGVEEFDLELEPYCHNALILALCQVQHLHQAQEALKNGPRDASSFEIVIAALGREDNLEEAEDLLEESDRHCREDFGEVLGIWVLDLLLRRAAKAGDVPRAMRMVKRMEALGEEVPVGALRSMLLAITVPYAGLVPGIIDRIERQQQSSSLSSSEASPPPVSDGAYLLAVRPFLQAADVEALRYLAPGSDRSKRAAAADRHSAARLVAAASAFPQKPNEAMSAAVALIHNGRSLEPYSDVLRRALRHLSLSKSKLGCTSTSPIPKSALAMEESRRSCLLRAAAALEEGDIESCEGWILRWARCEGSHHRGGRSSIKQRARSKGRSSSSSTTTTTTKTVRWGRRSF